MKYFKIKFGYSEHEYIGIDDSELDAAMLCFLSDSKGVFKTGVVRGKDIIAISEDWHKEMGWNPTHDLGDDDWAEIRGKGVDKKYVGVIASAKERVQYLMQTNQTHLVGKNVDVPKINEQKPVSDFSKEISEKFKIK